MSEEGLSAADLRDAWNLLSMDERFDGFQQLSRSDADDFFLALSAREAAEMLKAMPETERRLWARLLAPDDAADVVQSLGDEQRPAFLALLDEPTRREVTALLAYAEDAAGGLMSP